MDKKKETSKQASKTNTTTFTNRSIYNALPADPNAIRDSSSLLGHSTSTEAQPRVPDRRVLEAAQTRTTVGLPAGIELRSMAGSSITAVAPPYSRAHGGVNDDGSTFAFGGPNQLRDSVDGASGRGGITADEHARAHASHHHHHEHHHRHDHHYSPQRPQDRSQAERSPTKLIPRKQVPKQSHNDTTEAGPSQITSAVEPQPQPQPQPELQSQQQPTIPFHEDDNNQKENLPTPADYAALSQRHNTSSDEDSNEQIQTGNKQPSGEDSQAEFHYRQRQHGSQVAQLIYPEHDNIINNDNEDSHSETEAEIEREFNPRFRLAPTPDHHAAGKKTAQNSLGYAKHRNGGPPSTPPKGPAYLADLAAADDGGSAKTIRLVQPSLQHRPLPSIPSTLVAGEDAGAHEASRTAAAGEAPSFSSMFEREMSPPGAYPLTPAVHTWNDENTRRIPVLPHSDAETDTDTEEAGDEVSLLLPAAATPAAGESTTPFKKASSAPATPYPDQNADHYYTPVSKEEEGDSYRFTATPSWVSTISLDGSPLGSPVVSPRGSPDNVHSHTPEGNPDAAAAAAYRGVQSTSSPVSTTTSAARYDAYNSIEPTDHESIKSRLPEERDRVQERLAAHSRSSSAGFSDAHRRGGNGDNSGTATSTTGPATTVGQVDGLLRDRRPSQTSTFSAFSFSHTPPSMTRQDRGDQATAAPDSPLAGRSRSGAAANQAGHAGEAGGGGGSGGGVVSSIFGSLLGRSGKKHQRNEQSKDSDK